jgi:hypothetical protein
MSGNESARGNETEILLDRTVPTNCNAQVQATTIRANKMEILLNASDANPLNYSAFGDIARIISGKTFVDSDVIELFVEPSEGVKSVWIYIDDIAGNNCIKKELAVTIDYDFESQGIWVQGYNYWVDTVNVTIDIYFDHYPSQEPLEIFVSGAVSGSNANAWIPYTQGLSYTIVNSTKGIKEIKAKMRDTDGVETGEIYKKIYLNPAIELTDNGDGTHNVVLRIIQGVNNVTILGCTQAYNNVALNTGSAPYVCTPDGSGTISGTYYFDDGTDLTISGSP